MEQEVREEILQVLRKATEATVSTYGGENIRNRAMHYAVKDDFTFYLASMKGDPKIRHITNIPSITLLILHKASPPETYMDLQEFGKWSETEVHGKAVLVTSSREREEALKMLSERSPIVKLLYMNNQTHILEVIKVIPEVIKYKRVSDILAGKPPIVLDFTRREAKFEEFGIIKRKLKNIYYAMRLPFTAATIPSILLGGVLAYYLAGVFDAFLFILTLIGAVLAHIGLNMINDYYDHKLHTDIINKEAVSPFTGGSKVIQMGLLSPTEVLFASLVFLGVSMAIGIYLTIVSSIYVLLIALIGFLIIYMYHAPPFRAVGKKGLGELLVGIGFGPVYTLGAYVVQTGQLSLTPVIAATPLAIFVALILLVNEFPDYKADLETGKHHLVVVLGRAKARYAVYALYLAGFVSIIALYLMGIYPLYTLASLIAVPLAIYGLRNLHRHYDSPFDMLPAIVTTILTQMVVGFTIVFGYVMSILPNTVYLAIYLAGVSIYMAYELFEIRRGVAAFNLIKSMVQGANR